MMRYHNDNIGWWGIVKEKKAGRDVQEVPLTDRHSDGFSSDICWNFGQKNRRTKDILLYSYPPKTNRWRSWKDQNGIIIILFRVKNDD